MSDLSGIYSLRGFLYQMQIYELFAFQHGWENDDVMIYEGLDDIDSEKTYLLSSNHSFAQIKSGSLTKTVYYGVLSNWFLLDNSCPNSNFSLVFEQGDPSNFKSNEFFEDYYAYISSSDMKNKHPNCKHSKACGLFASKTQMKTAFDYINNRVSFKQLTLENIYELLVNEAVNHAIKNEMMAKAFVYHFIDTLHHEVEESILRTERYELTKKKYHEIYNSTLNSVQRRKYIFNKRKYAKYKLEDLEKMADKKFYEQIKSVSGLNQFLVENIIDELEYEIFKESYDDKESLDKIDNLEMSVHSRYSVVIANPKYTNNYELYIDMVGGSYLSDILEMDYGAKIGCCNYLTSSNADPSCAIEWDVFDD